MSRNDKGYNKKKFQKFEKSYTFNVFIRSNLKKRREGQNEL